MPDQLSWTELVVLMVDVPEPVPTIRGTIRSLDGDDESRRYHVFVHHQRRTAPTALRGVRDGFHEQLGRRDR